MRYFIVAGEASGDLHGSNLVRGISDADPGAEVYCWGGDLMEKAGAELLMHYRKNAFMGFLNVMLHLPSVISNLRLCKKQLTSLRPDAVILIDYPGFNLRMARYARRNGFKVLYYISPKLWAWNESRVKIIKKYVDRMFIIFPFEKEFYSKHGIEVSYYGNPLTDEIDKFRNSFISSRNDHSSVITEGNGSPIIALVPGSRLQEVRYILPEMLKVIPFFPEYTFIITATWNIPSRVYEDLTRDYPVKTEYGRTYEILSMSEAALVKSGTSTLEAALLGVPQVVCYKGDAVSFFIARRLVKVKYISLVNLILGREAVKELIQHLLTGSNLVASLKEILPGGKERERMLKDYDEIKQILGPAGASQRIASEMVSFLRKK